MDRPRREQRRRGKRLQPCPRAARPFGRQRQYKPGVYILPKKLDEEVARLHLEKIGVKLTTLTKKQSEYLGVPVDGPYKAEHLPLRDRLIELDACALMCLVANA